jgi:hypothetical protein
VHVNVTTNPTAAWVWRQVIQATPWGTRPRHLLRDRDAVYGRDFRERAKRIGIDAIATPVRSPRANAIAERVIGTLRRECRGAGHHRRRRLTSAARRCASPVSLVPPWLGFSIVHGLGSAPLRLACLMGAAILAYASPGNDARSCSGI